MLDDDLWNPRTWADPADDNFEYRIYGTTDLSVYAIVDAIDYPFLAQWLWSPKFSRGGRVMYLRRNISLGSYERRIQRCRFLHTEVMERKGEPRPSIDHILDHADSDPMNCRRGNLRWVTHRFNRYNRNGALKNIAPFEFRAPKDVFAEFA